MKSESEDFQIGVKTNVPLGYAENVCVECSNKMQSIQRKVLKVKQTDKCITSLTAAGNELPDPILEFSVEIHAKRITEGWSSFFTNSDESMCPITKCSLLKAGCKAVYDGKIISMDK